MSFDHFQLRLNPQRLAAPVAAIALLAGLASVAMAQPADGPAAGAGPRHAGMHRMGPGAGGEMPGMVGAGLGLLPERELDAVGASAEQKTKVREILRAAHDDLRKQHDGARELHQQMMQLLAAPKVDAAAAEALRQKIHAQHDVASKRMLQAALEAGAVLTPEQRQKLAERRKQMNDRMPPPPGEREGPRGPRG
ncbi:periplasmic heavy metal sensor [Ideonella sp. DXS22W]|uniref:Periplasmic heavy metal sensor n=1 Tax=Pseudaquabacterium inlustre TaxID=2984192 RepID=A0ABU9CFE0_9BURK